MEVNIMGYWNRSYNIESKYLKSVEEYKAEHKAIQNQIEAIVQTAFYTPKELGMIRESAKTSVQDELKNEKTKIQGRNRLADPRCAQYCYSSVSTESTAPAECKDTRTITDTCLTTLMKRQECITQLVNTYLKVDQETIDAEEAMLRMTTLISNNTYNIGYNNSIRAKVGDKGKIEVTEEECNWRKGTFNWKAKVHVDSTWIDKVYKNKIAKVDIAGKTVMTLDADEIMDHELKDQNVRMWDATVFYSKVPSNVNPNYAPKGTWKQILHKEKRVIVVETLPSGDTQMATGKDISWATRTMRMRMKSSMLKQMGLK